MHAFIQIGIFTVSVAFAAEPNPRELIAAVTKRPWPGESYPALPALSSTMQGQVGNEIAASPAVRAAFNQLDSARNNNDWFAGIEALEQQKALWSLQAALCHPQEDVQIHAIRALGRLKDPRAVPFLLIYADYMAVFEGGSRNAALHGIIHKSLAQTLSAITGVSVTLDRQDPDGLKRAIRQWAQWNLDQTK